ncbi:unnamed protein product, partial [Angiostrongylus costaricensis]|uniref:RNA helicase n=1 Tax=Angiostrongylus costaricensis TaxID=334426 RepID=A0A0R3PQ80_ANGCS
GGYGSGSYGSGGRGFSGGRGGGGGGGGGNPGGRLRDIDWSKENLKPIQKNFYHEHATVTRRDQYEIDQWIAENQVTLDGRGIPRPVWEFSEASFPNELTDLLYAKFQKPTVIQSISWPIAMSGRDIISIAKTGSGKTLAFMLPAIIHTTKQAVRGRYDGPSVLVLLPTRELAQQVQEVSIDFCNALGLKLACLFGGASKGPQARDLERGVDIVVYVFFCQALIYKVRTLASDFQRDAAFLNVGSMELAANHNITQFVDVLEEHAKQSRMMQLLNDIMNQPECKTIIFVETKRKADDLTRWMRRDGWPTLCIHGDKNQGERDWVLSEFRAGKTPIMLATDVAARGLDVDDIKFVINYDYPNNSEDYVHRIGRTGRRDKRGTAYTFFTPQNAPKAKDLIKVLEEAGQTVPQPLRDLQGRAGTGNSRGRWAGSSGGGMKRGYSGSDDYSGKKGRYDNGGGYGGGRW